MKKFLVSMIIVCISSTLFAAEFNENEKRHRDEKTNNETNELVKKARVSDESPAKNEVIALLIQRTEFFDTIIARLTALKEQQEKQKQEISSLEQAFSSQAQGQKSQSSLAPMEIEGPSVAARPKESPQEAARLLQAGRTGSIAAVSALLKLSPPPAPTKISPSVPRVLSVAKKSTGGLSPAVNTKKAQSPAAPSPKALKHSIIQSRDGLEGTFSENKLYKCLLSLVNHKGAITSLTCDSEGKRIFSVGTDKILNIWDTRTKHLIKMHHLSIEPLFLRTYSPTVLALGAPQGHLDLLMLDTGEIKERIGKEGRGITALALSPDKKFVAKGSTREQKHGISFWQIGQKSQKKQYNYLNPIRALCFTNDNQSIIIAMGTAIDIINIHTQESTIIQEHKSPVTLLCPLTDALFASAAEDGTLVVWDLKNCTLKQRIEKAHIQGITALAFDPQENILFSGSKDGIVKCWDVQKGLYLDSIKSSSGKGITALCHNPHTGDVIIGLANKEIQVWQKCVRKEPAPQNVAPVPHYEDMPDLTEWQRSRAPQISLTPEKTVLPVSPGSSIVSLCTSCNSGELVAGYADGSIKRINPERLMPLLESHAGPVLCMRLNPYVSQQLITGSQDSTIRIWDLATNSCIETLSGDNGHKASVTSVIPHPNPAYKDAFISTSEDNTIKIWDISNGSCVQTLQQDGPISLAVPVQTSPHHIITASGTYITLWDLEKESILKKHAAADSLITALLPYYTESANNEVIVASEKGTIYIVNVDTGYLKAILRGHTGSVKALCLHPHEKHLLLSTAQDGSTRIWNLKTSKCIYVSTESSGYGTTLLPHPTNPAIAIVGTSRGTIQELMYPQSK